MSGRPVRKDVARTGEITLRGRVLPMGGLKEKVLGAHRARITGIALPKDNEADIEDIPEDVQKSVRFHPVFTLDEVFEGALLPAVQAVNTPKQSMEEEEERAERQERGSARWRRPLVDCGLLINGWS